MSAGAYEPVERIRPVAPAPSLLTTARALPAGVNWQSGISWMPMCQPSYSWRWCPPTTDMKVVDDVRTKAYSRPFQIYTPLTCDLTSPDQGQLLSDIASELTVAHTAERLGAALWMGDGYEDFDPAFPQVTLRRDALDVSAGSAVDLDDGVAILLAEYEAATGGNGGATFHLPSTLVPAALGGSNTASRVMWPEGTIYRGALGAVFSPGPGYPIGLSVQGANGFGPRVSGAQTTPEVYKGNSAYQSWVYVTGPVEYAVTDVVIRPEADVQLDWRMNRWFVYGERWAILRFDPCTCLALLVHNPAPAEAS